MNGFNKQELEKQSFMDKLFGGNQGANGLTEITNFLADAKRADELTKEQANSFLKKWGCKFNEENMSRRSGIYRIVADNAFVAAQTADDEVLNTRAHIAEILEVPAHLCAQADRAAKKTAYFARCRNIISGEEKLDINQVNEVFGYDYEDGFDIRKQVFTDHFNGIFDKIVEAKSFSPDQEKALRAICEKLDIPYEFKAHIDNALTKYRYLWSAANAELGDVQVDFPLQKDEKCHAATEAYLCEVKEVAKEDNYFQLTRKLRIDETISFKGEHIEHPKVMEEMAIIIDSGYLFLTNQRVIYLSKKNLRVIDLENLKTHELASNVVNLTLTDDNVVSFKMHDDPAEVMYAILCRIMSERK